MTDDLESSLEDALNLHSQKKRREQESDAPIKSQKEVTITGGGSRLSMAYDGGIEFNYTGIHLWRSKGPLFSLHYYDRQHPRCETLAVPLQDSHAFGTAGTTSLSSTSRYELEVLRENALRIIVKCPNIRIQLALQVEIDPSGGSFTVRLEDDGILEGMPELYRLMGIEIFPQFGFAKSKETGYLTLPNWSGCQTFFNKNYPREVRQTVYSSNDQWEHVCNMPVFGITRASGTLCGLITRGDYDAQLICRAHWEKEQANSVHPLLVYRWAQEDPRITGPREIRYSFAPPNYADGEGYVFVAKEYRNFLCKDRGLLSWDEKSIERPVVLDYRDRFFMKIFMAFKAPQPDGRGAYRVTCTFTEAREILQSCLERGMKKIAVMLVGWGQDGHDGMPPTRFPVDERLGGEKAFRQLIQWCRENDIMLGVHDSYGGAYECSPEFDMHDAVKHRTGEPWAGVVWSGGQVYNLCPQVYVQKHTQRDVTQIRALGIHGHHHIDAVGSFMTCFSKDHPLKGRAEYVAQVREMFRFSAEQIGSVSTELPFGPYFDVVDGYFHSYSDPYPWHLASAIGRYFFDRSIPLLQIVLHGSVNCCESTDKFVDQPLRWIEWGLCPQAEVSMRAAESFGIRAYDSVADRLSDLYRFHFSGDRPVPRLNPFRIEGRWEIADGISHTRYSDGTLLRVNTGSQAYGDLGPESYCIGRI